MAALDSREPVKPIKPLTVADAAVALGVSAKTVREMIASGKLVPNRIGNGRGTLRFSPAEIERYLASTTGSSKIMRAWR